MKFSLVDKSLHKNIIIADRKARTKNRATARRVKWEEAFLEEVLDDKALMGKAGKLVEERLRKHFSKRIVM